MSSYNGIEIDLSELEGRSFECSPQCGLCCLCQPELLPEERAYFRKNHPHSTITKTSPHRHTALALKKGRGSCVFLKDRRCTVYPHRPRFCRQFPYHFHVGERVQVELDLSCRGVWGEGQDAKVEAEGLIRANLNELRSTLRESKAVYSEFHSNCQEAGIYRDPNYLRDQVALRATKLTDMGYLAQVVEASYMDDELVLSDLDAPTAFDMDELEDAARQASLDSLASEDPVHLPVYCDEGWQWNLFSIEGNEVLWNVLDDQGDLHLQGSVDPEGVPLLVPEEDGRRLLQEYISMLNRRDSVQGNAYFLVDSYGYEDHVSNVYCGVLSIAILDLLWRSSLIAHLKRSSLDRNGVREGIIFYDMDRLDAPTIGAFI